MSKQIAREINNDLRSTDNYNNIINSTNIYKIINLLQLKMELNAHSLLMISS